MNKLPKIYKNDIKKRINNNKQMCYVEEGTEENSKDIEEKLKHVFAGLGSLYNTKVFIKTKDAEYNTTLISKDKNELVTQENKIIKIKDIQKLEVKK